MGQLTTEKGKVCFIQSDEPENAADKLKVMGINSEFHLITDWSSFNEDKLTALQQQKHYDLIVLDSLTTFLGGQTRRPEHERRRAGFDLYPLNQWASKNRVMWC